MCVESMRMLGVALALVWVSTSGAAWAARTVGEEKSLGNAVRWNVDDVRLTYLPAGSPLPASEIIPFFEYASAVWRPACLSVRLTVAEDPAGSPAAAGDGQNSISWLRSGWQEHGFDASAPAATDVQLAVSEAGEAAIVEADLYLNAEGFDWTSAPADGTVAPASVLVHEFGHVLGLAHPCEAAMTPELPACSDDPQFDMVVMNPEYSSTRLTLSGDDREGVCALYRGGEHPAEAGGAAGAGGNGGAASDCQENANGCQDAARSFGEDCQQTSDCASRVCIQRQATGVCSRGCSNGAQCPTNWSCRQVDLEPVCVPADVSPSGACSQAPPLATFPSILGGLGLLLLWAARRANKTFERSDCI